MSISGSVPSEDIQQPTITIFWQGEAPFWDIIHISDEDEISETIHKLENYIDGLAQDCSNSSALAMQLLQSCPKPSICGKSNWITVTSHKT